MIHPAVLKAFGIDVPVAALAIHLDAIPAPRATGRARPAYVPPALQAITRDFAFIVPADLSADNLVRAIGGADKAAITNVRPFDRFESADGLSLAFEVTLQPAEKSFTDGQIGEISRRIVAAAEKLGARLRS
jgi:phenylalanyl-tRNA synthetase beta chain